MPEFDEAIHMRETRSADMIQTEQDRVMAHQLQDKENKKLLEKEGILLGEEEENEAKGEQVEKPGEEEMEEELVDYEERQDRGQENEDGEDKRLDS
jgi:hypothetical protein